jgi:hypothetical protein
MNVKERDNPGAATLEAPFFAFRLALRVFMTGAARFSAGRPLRDYVSGETASPISAPPCAALKWGKRRAAPLPVGRYPLFCNVHAAITFPGRDSAAARDIIAAASAICGWTDLSAAFLIVDSITPSITRAFQLELTPTFAESCLNQRRAERAPFKIAASVAAISAANFSATAISAATPSGAMVDLVDLVDLVFMFMFVYYVLG